MLLLQLAPTLPCLILPISQVILFGYHLILVIPFFSAHIVDRQAYKSNTWIINTVATDYMVHSVSCLSTITSTINTLVYLPNEEKALVIHIGTVHISEWKELGEEGPPGNEWENGKVGRRKDFLVRRIEIFNLISVSQSLKHSFAVLCFFFIQDLAN